MMNQAINRERNSCKENIRYTKGNEGLIQHDTKIVMANLFTLLHPLIDHIESIEKEIVIL